MPGLGVDAVDVDSQHLQPPPEAFGSPPAREHAIVFAEETKMKKPIAIFLLALCGLLLGTAKAATLDFVIGDASNVVFSQDDFYGGYISATPSADLAGRSFSLAPGESATFDFFDISFLKCLVCGGTATVNATLDFASPDVSAGGTGWGVAWSLLGVLTAGALHWETQGGLISSAIGDFLVQFNDLPLGLAFGDTATVTATVTAVSAVPLPAAVWLFGSAVLALAGVNMRRRREAL